MYVKSMEVAAGKPQARFTIAGMSGIADHITIKQGRMAEAAQREDGVFECIATEKSLKTTELAVGSVYEVGDVFHDDAGSAKIEIVGTFDVKDETLVGPHRPGRQCGSHSI